MAMLVFEMQERFLAASDLQALEQLCRSICDGMGFEYFLYGSQIPISLVKPREIILTNYPAAWWERYLEQDYRAKDPVLAHCDRSIAPLLWNEIPDLNRFGKKFFNEAGECGLPSGLTVVLRGSRFDVALLSVVCIEDAAKANLLYRERMAETHLLLNFLHDNIVRVLASAGDLPTFQLTSRQRECLLWAAEGKDTHSISEILHISSDTVSFHFKEIAERLNTSNRAHSVTRAVTFGLIEPTLQ